MREDSIANSPGLCYHCDNSIPVGSEVTVIKTADGGYYRMHKACADKEDDRTMTFRDYLNEQLEDPEFREFWEARNEAIFRHTVGTMTLSDMPLTQEDEDRIRYILENPEELDAMVDALIQKHQVTDLYEAARKMPPGEAMRMAQSAETDEERKFWAFIADMNLQRAQKEAIENNLF